MPIRPGLFGLFATVTLACSSTSVPASDAGAAPTPTPTPVAGATLTFTVNGLAIVADRNLHGKSTDGTKISIGGDRSETTSTKYWTINIDLANLTAPGTYKCTDNREAVTTKPRTTFTYASADNGSIILNQPAIPTSAPFAGDCTVTVTTLAAKAGDHYLGTFSATGLKGAAGTVDITNGIFDVTRTP